MSTRLSRKVIFILTAPALILFTLLTVYPLGRNLLLSFFDTDYGLAGARFVGLENYTYLFADYFFQRALWNTTVFTLTATALEVTAGLLLALLVNRAFPGRRFLLPLLVMPFVLSTMVVTAIWRAWFHFDLGFLNTLMVGIGLNRVEWLTDPSIAMASVILVDLWQTFPIVFLIVLAGLQAVPDEVKEAARLDGAGPFRMLTTITLPLIMPHLLLAALLRCVESFKIFDKVFALTGGGPGQATETLSLFVYRLGFRFFDIGLAAAASIVMVVVAAALSAVYAWRIASHGQEPG